MISTYLSPRRFSIGGYGVDTSNLSAAQLRQALRRATAKVDSYVNGPMLPVRHDLRGGSITAEQHPWNVDSPLLQTRGSRRVYLYHRPIRTISRFVIKFTKNYQVELAATPDLYENHIEGYGEVVAVAAIVTGVYPVGINFGLYTPIAEVDYTYGWKLPVAGDVLEAETTVLYYASSANWDATVTPVVYRAGATESAANYTIDYDDGSVLFAAGSEPAPGETMTVDYTATLPPAIEEAAGIIAADEVIRSRNRVRLAGLSSIKVAEVALVASNPGAYAERNGVSIPLDAAKLLDGFSEGAFGGR